MDNGRIYVAQVEEKVKEAMESNDRAEEAYSGNETYLREAKVKLQKQTEPLARRAVDAQNLVHRCLQNAPQKTRSQ